MDRMHTYLPKIALLLIVVWLGLPMLAAESNKPFTVVIDAGHGGKDPGAVGKISQEKDLNLSISLLVGQLIKKSHPDVKVIYTRQTDEFISLQGRANIVNKNNADLFICIHTNSTENKSAKGAETFVLGTEKMEQNLDVAMRENSVIQLEQDYKTQYQGFDPNSIDSYIMFELMQNQYMDQSLRFATLIQQQFVGNLHRDDRGVRQAAFWVLLKSACPSVLVEIGFISNPEEEKYLASGKGQNELAEAIHTAFCSFYKRNTKQAEEPSVQNADTQEKTPVKEEVKKIEKTAKENSKTQEKKATKSEKIEKEVKNTSKQEIKSDTTQNAPVDSLKTAEVQTLYAIQIMALREPLKPKDSRLKGVEPKYVIRNGWCKYICGLSTNRAETAQKLKEMKSLFPDCFIIEVQSSEIK